MPSAVGGENALLGSLYEIIGLHLDAAEAVGPALDKITRPGDRRRLESFLEDHEHQLAELAALASELGADPEQADGLSAWMGERRPRSSRSTIGLLTHGLIGDRTILEASLASEEDICAAYERAVARDDVPGKARAPFQRGLVVARHHRDWFAEQLDARQGLMLLPL